MSESEFVPKPKPKPQLYSPIDAWQKQQDTRSEAQKDQIPFQTPDAVMSINAAVVELQGLLKELREDFQAFKSIAMKQADFDSVLDRIRGLEDRFASVNPVARRGPGRPPKVQEG